MAYMNRDQKIEYMCIFNERQKCIFREISKLEDRDLEKAMKQYKPAYATVDGGLPERTIVNALIYVCDRCQKRR